MLTVVIAEQSHLDLIREYDLFLHPFTENSNAEFCVWNPQGENLSECVPTLKDTVSRTSSWRAIIIADDGLRRSKNPFDKVRHKDALPDEILSCEQNLEKRRDSRFSSFREACKQPLVKLTSYLGDFPTVTSFQDSFLHREFVTYTKILEENTGDPDVIKDAKEYFESEKYKEYLEYREHYYEAVYKSELKDELTSDEGDEFFKPEEIICIARRTFTGVQEEIKTSWESHHSFEYSNFADYNMYIPKLRYVLFDILPDEHINYRFDNIKFLYAVLILAGNELPQDSLHPERVYVLNCENDEEILSDHLSRFDRKLLATQNSIRAGIRACKENRPERLTTKEARDIFCTDTHISLRFEKGYNEETLYVRPKRFGLFRENPEPQNIAWSDEITRSRKSLTDFLRQPQKALSFACEDFRLQNEGDPSKVLNLNRHQIDEFKEYLNLKESRSVEERPLDFANTDKIHKELEESEENVEERLDGRINRKGFLISLLSAALLYAVSFVPFLIKAEFEPLGWISSLGAVLLLILISFVCLFVFRYKLRKTMKAYNEVMEKISEKIHASMESFSAYLSELCSFMRGNTSDNVLAEEISATERQCRIYNKHIADIQELRENFAIIFTDFINRDVPDEGEIEIFDYDFRIPRNYEYPLVINNGMLTPVEYIQPDFKIELGVDFIRKIELRMEEFYD
ncbi:MAG: hypothetical protein Q4C42_10115 [Clostridia bacterium]|nr:hypothetical protein [Clostridia bacterium]